MKPFSPLIQRILLILPFIVVFVSSLFHPYDPDLGWHLKYGQYFFDPPAGGGRILKENILSTEMPNYTWANSSWMTDLISYLTFDAFGFLGLSILGASVITLTFYFFSKAAKLDYFEKALIFPLLLYLIAPLNSVSFKGQLLSLLFTGILVFILKKYEDEKSKIIFVLIPLFLVWSNMHGQFILGLMIFGLWSVLFVTKLLLSHPRSEHRISLAHSGGVLAAVFVLSALAVIINPFGIGVYTEAIKHSGNPWQKYIYEWLPQEELSVDWWKQIGVGVILFISSLLVIFGGNFFSKLTSLIVAPFYAMSFLVRRYLWTTYYLAIPFLQPLVAFLKPESKKWQAISGTVILVIFLGMTFFVDNPIKRIKNMGWQSYCQKFIQCSDRAAEFIAKNGLANEKLLTFYNWGGWLIWNHPEVKPSIDGRMHLWQDETGYSAFAYYYPFEQNAKDIDISKYDAVLMSPNKNMYDRLLELVDKGKWRLVYEDELAGVFVRN